MGNEIREDIYLCSQCKKTLFFPFVSLITHYGCNDTAFMHLCKDCTSVCILLDDFIDLSDHQFPGGETK